MMSSLLKKAPPIFCRRLPPIALIPAPSNPNEDEEEAYSLVEDFTDNVVIITTASAAPEDKDQGGRGRSIQGI